MPQLVTIDRGFLQDRDGATYRVPAGPIPRFTPQHCKYQPPVNSNTFAYSLLPEVGVLLRFIEHSRQTKTKPQADSGGVTMPSALRGTLISARARTQDETPRYTPPPHPKGLRDGMHTVCAQ